MAENEKPQTTASVPVFNINVDPNISWEVKDDEIGTLENPLETTHETPIEEEREPEEDIDESEEEEEERPKRKNKKSSQRRIAELNYKLKTAEQIAYQLASEKEELEKQLVHQQKMSLGQYENLLKTNKETIKAAMIEAHESGDSRQYAHAADLLSQYNAELKDVEERKRISSYQQRQQTHIPQEVFDTEYEEEIDPEITSNTQEWMKNNPWANPSSRHFNQELWEEADQYSAWLMKSYQIEGRGDEIGTPEFFQEINHHMKENYQIKKSSPNKMRAPTNNVAPVSRNLSASYRRPVEKTNLSQEERQIAHQLRGLVRDKNGNYITDNKTLEQIYLRNRGR